jgi:hypothetical protein
MNADEIKKAIIEKHTIPAKPVESAEMFGVKGWLFRSSSYQMEGWRQVSNDKDPEVQRLGPAKLIQISFRDESGKLVFEELDLPMIGGMDDSDVNLIFKRCLSINGYGGEGCEALLKNLIAIYGTDGVYASLVNINAPCPNCSKDTKNTNSESNTSPSNTGPAATQPRATKPSSPDRSQDRK